MKRSLAALLALTFFLRPTAVPGQDTSAAMDASSAEIVHVLNRITFGPRPGDVEMVQKMGLQNYIEQQLHPETLDDSAVETEVAHYSLLGLSNQQLLEMYKAPKEAKREARAAQTLAYNQAKAAGQAPDPSALTDATALAGKHAKGGKKPDDTEAAGVAELENAKLIRAVDSPKQLQEVLVDFWTNHFNIDVKKKECRVFIITDDRDVIRPNIFGKFRDLLEATAKSPAMLVYLDNVTNSAPNDGPAKVGKKGKPKKETGINENYGREVMELHTLGVDAGYTQADVTNVARCFTGWTINHKTGEFEFDPSRHDNSAKVVLGHTIPAGGGIKDGEMVLDILCSQPACAHFISKELCQRFVADDPPAALVDRVAGVFTATGGDLRQVYAAILSSPEFLAPSDYGNKIKSPLEFAVSAIRASGATFAPDLSKAGEKEARLEGGAVRNKQGSDDRMAAEAQQPLDWHVYTLGEPLFACTPPTGYKENSKIWVSPGALIERLNFALALTGQQISDVKFDPRTVVGAADLDMPQRVMDQCIGQLLHDNVTDGTRKVLSEAALPTGDSQTVHPQKLIALILGSPEFQRK
jgi:uncharacterized protein (DUF1800 family)